jgi:DNA-binding transcriptional MerR regulator
MIQKGKNTKQPRLISAKDITGKYNISYQTVNHYTDFGLLHLLIKKGNIRFYDEFQVRSRLAKITRLAREGYSLRLIRKKLLGV